LSIQPHNRISTGPIAPNRVMWHHYRWHTTQFGGWRGHQRFGSQCQLLATWAHHRWHTRSTTSRLNVPRINTPPSATLPKISSCNSTPIPPRTRLKSSETGGPQPPTQSAQNGTSSKNVPPDPPYLSGFSAASGSQPRRSSTSSRKSGARAPQPASSSSSSNANATLLSTPRHLGKLKWSQRSLSLPPSSHSTRPSHSQDDNVPRLQISEGK
jgi:hypothetical protein